VSGVGTVFQDRAGRDDGVGLPGGAAAADDGTGDGDADARDRPAATSAPPEELIDL
jgi:hypothetical protein